MFLLSIVLWNYNGISGDIFQEFCSTKKWKKEPTIVFLELCWLWTLQLYTFTLMIYKVLIISTRIVRCFLLYRVCFCKYHLNSPNKDYLKYIAQLYQSKKLNNRLNNSQVIQNSQEVRKTCMTYFYAHLWFPGYSN